MNQSMRDNAARAIEREMILFRLGWDACLTAHPPCEHTHNAIADSVARMFPHWDGAHAAHLRSVDRFRSNNVSEEANAA